MFIFLRIKLDVIDSKESIDAMVCHYVDTNDVFLVGESVLQNESLIVCALRHFSQNLAWFHLAGHQRIYLHQYVFDGIISKEPMKIFFS